MQARRILIQGQDYSGELRTLVHKATGQPVAKGEVVNNFRGQPRIIKGGTAPHKPESTGRINTNAGELFPSVCDLEWQ